MKSNVVKKGSVGFRKSKVAAASLCVGALGFASVGVASGQGSSAPSERAKRDAEKVFSWMKLQSVDAAKPAAASGVAIKEERPVVVAKPPAKPVSKAGGESETALVRQDPRAAELAQVLEKAPSASGVSSSSTPGVLAEQASTLTAPPLALETEAMSAVSQPEEPSQLVPLRASEPEFPISLKQMLRQGRVQVAFDIRPDGSVTDVRVISSSSQRLNRFVVSAVEQWQFAPIQRTQTAGTEFHFDEPWAKLQTVGIK
jgi:TonB family protein